MKIQKKKGSGVHEGDLTPMIDMTFQLIAFFMVLINLSDAEQNQAIKLPESTLAKPPEQPFEYSITIHVTDDGNAILNGQEIPISELGPYLNSEKTAIVSTNKSIADTTIIIRGDVKAKTGHIQELIKICQDNSFEVFALRAKEKVRYGK